MLDDDGDFSLEVALDADAARAQGADGEALEGRSLALDSDEAAGGPDDDDDGSDDARAATPVGIDAGVRRGPGW
ncbi:MAG: hypothetical protein R2939_05580 [Kofleriaceae bacterium]